MSKRPSFPLVVCWFSSAMLTSPYCHSRPLDAVGNCPFGARLEYSNGNYSGDVNALLRDKRFTTANALNASHFPPWLLQNRWKSAKNRTYKHAGVTVIVATLCDLDNCDQNRAYIGFEPSTANWGASIYAGRNVVEVGRPTVAGSSLQVMPDSVAAAVICAQNSDWK